MIFGCSFLSPAYLYSFQDSLEPAKSTDISSDSIDPLKTYDVNGVHEVPCPNSGPHLHLTTIESPVEKILIVSVIIILCLLCFVLVVWLYLQFDGKNRARLSALSKRRRVVLVFALVSILAMSGFGFYSVQVLKEKQSKVTATLLSSMLDSTRIAITNYLDREKKTGQQIALLATEFPLFSQDLPVSTLAKRWHEYLFENNLLNGRFDIQIISKNYIVLCSVFSSLIGQKIEMSGVALEHVNRAFAGETTVFLSRNDLLVSSEAHNSLIGGCTGRDRFAVASPIYNSEAAIEAVILIPSITLKNLSFICESSRVGTEGEIYLVDSDGQMLTSGRFSKEAVCVTPGALNKETHLSLAAREVAGGKSSNVLTNYKNYLGNSVAGVWLWDENLSIGYIFEISLEELGGLLEGQRHIILAVVIVCAILAGTIFSLIFLHGEYRSRALRKSRDHLESLADSRLQELKKNEELYSLVLNSTNDGIWEWSIETGKLTFSDRYLEILGYSHDEFATDIDDWMRFVHPDDRSMVHHQLTPCLEGNVPKISVVFRMCHKKGYWLWLQGTGIHVKDQHGKVIRLAGTHADVTARKVAEVELKQRERKFSAVFNQSVNFTGILDAEGRILEFNDYAQRITSQKIEDVAGTLIWDCPWVLASSGLSDYFKEIIQKVLQGTQISFEREMIAFSNRNFVFNMTVSPIRDENGLVQLILLSGHDVTQTRNVEQYLRNSEQRFRAMFQNFPVVYYSINQEGIIKDCNDMFTDVLGYSRSETLGKKISDFYAPEHEGTFQSRLDYLQRKGVFEGESNLIHKDGSLINFILTSRAQYDVSGKFVRSHSMLVDITERKSIEILQGRLNAILENTPAAICMQDLDGKFLYANDVWAGYLGLQAHQLTGKKVEEIFHEREAELLLSTFNRVLKTEESEVWEIVHLFSGEEHFFQNQSFPIRDSENNLQAIGHISTEITEQRLAQIELRKAQAILKSIMDNSSAMVFAKNMDGEYTMMNGSFCSFWGLDPVESLGKGDRELFSDELADFYLESDMEVIGSGSTLSMENTIESPVTGITQTMYLEKFIIYDEDGEINGTGGIATDITPIKEIQDLLQASEERLRFSLASMGTYYWEYNFLTDQLVYDSTDYFSQFGYTLSEIPTNMSSYRGFIHFEDVGKVDELFTAHVERKLELFKTEYRFKARDGKWFWNLDIGRVVERTESGSPLKLAGITIDISERKEMEAWLNLERDKAEAAALAKTQFMANMSHEIRTPMNAIIGLCYLLGKTETNRKQQSYLSKIDSSSKSLLGIINDILDFSKIEAGKVALEHTNFEFEDIISQLNSYFGHMALSKGLAFEFDIDKKIPPVLRGDSHRLQQILTNLISNAVKFTETGKVVVEAQLIKNLNDRVEVKIEVSDTGIGIAQDEISKVFKAFSQADESTTRRFGGTGLGLSITHSLVLMMGGSIKVTSKKGQGSKFIVKLSFDVGETRLPVNTVDTLVPDLHSKNILLAEDNLLNQEVIIGLLEDTGCSITAVEDGLQALDEMKKGIYDLVLMDVQMSTMDGLKATQKMRAWELAEGKQRLPILAITADVLSEDHRKTKAAGMDGHIDKPVSPTEMFKEIVRWTGAKNIPQTVSRAKEIAWHIEGLDAKTAIARLDGREELFVKLLKQFSVDKADVVDQIKSALESGDRSWAESLVHSLKGLAGTIEATELRSVTNHLENAIKVSGDNVEEYLLLVEGQVDLLVHAIEQFFNTQTIENIDELKSISPEELTTELSELKRLLNNGDPKAIAKIQQLVEEGLNETVLPGTSQLIKLVERFDFEKALKLLNQ